MKYATPDSSRGIPFIWYRSDFFLNFAQWATINEN